MQKAKFIRKARTVQDYFAQVRMSQQEAEEYIVEKTVELTASEYDDLANGLLMDRDWIIENIPLSVSHFHGSKCNLRYCRAVPCFSF